MKKSCPSFGFLFALLLFAAPAYAQISETGMISGTVRDVDGNPLAGVTVTLDSVEVPSQGVFTRPNGTYRFVALPPGVYKITFGMTGFATSLNEGVVVSVAGNAMLNSTLALANVEETVTVIAANPVVDVKNTGVSKNFSEQYLQTIPSAREQWTLMEHSPGLQVDRENLAFSGRSGSDGHWSTYTAAGSDTKDTVWTYDGTEVTDISWFGGSSSPIHYDFDAFDEVTISTGGNDPSISTGGMRVNFVTKRGGNSWRGSGRFYFTNESLQVDPLYDRDGDEYKAGVDPDELQPGYVGNATDSYKDFGFEIGGPLARDRLFAWGAYGKQDVQDLIGTSPKRTQNSTWHLKVTGHLGDSDVLNFTFLHSNKIIRGQFAGPLVHPDATLDQDEPSPFYSFKWQHSFKDGTYLETALSYAHLAYALEPRGGRNVQPAYDYYTGEQWGSWFYADLDRPLTNFRSDGNSYVAEKLGVDHEFKYGYSYRRAEASSVSGYAAGAMRVFWDGDPIEAWVVSPRKEIYRGERHSVYFGDTLTAGRWIISPGVRYDYQTSVEEPSSTPPSSFDPELFPARSFAGNDPGWGWGSWSPRFGLSYDITGDARTLARFNAARYYSQMTAWELAMLGTTGWAEIDYEWFDLNGNELIDQGETGNALWVTSGFDPENPDQPSPNRISKTTPPITDEVIVGVDHEIVRNVSIGGSYIWKSVHNTTWSPTGGITSANYFPVIYDIDPVGEVEIYNLDQPKPNWSHYRQREDFRTSYKGLQLTLAKRFSDNWMANASFDWADYKQHYDSPAAYLDPTNIEESNHRPRVSHSARSSYASFGAARWFFRSSGMYQLPSGFTLAGYFTVREGNISPQSVISPRRPNGLGRIRTYVERIGDTKLPTYWRLDLRAEKMFDLGGRTRVHVIGDIFNVFNNDIVLSRAIYLNVRNYDKIREVTQGLTLRLGVRLVLG